MSIFGAATVTRITSGRAPGGRDFFNLFEEAGANIQRAAELLHQLLESWPEGQQLSREILICEQEGDRITHDIIHLLNRGNATPIDRQDIYELAGALDDVVDYIEEAADFLGLYRVEAPMDQAQRMSGVLRDACRNLAGALEQLPSFANLNHYFVEINRLENEGDRIVREALASLFANGVDPMVVIRWKDIFERVEQAIDACEHVSNILEGIVVRQT
jgi:predicted phosphate transport protein (TIGR00153 family)